MYLLMFVIGFILVIGGIWLLWRGQTVEGMADTGTVVMAAIGDNTTYFADIGLTNRPNWAPTGGMFRQISGSLGRLMGVDVTQNQAYYGTKYDLSGSVFNWLTIPGSVTQISFDYPLAVGLTPSKTIVYIDNIPSNPQTTVWKPVEGINASKTFNYIATSEGRAVAAGTDNKLWYCSNIRLPIWADISTGVLSGIPVKNIAFDVGDLVVVDTNNTVYFANNMGEVNDNVGLERRAKIMVDTKTSATPAVKVDPAVVAAAAAKAAAAAAVADAATIKAAMAAAAASGVPPIAGILPNWKAHTQKMKQVSIRNHMGAAIGTDNRVYFAGNLKDNIWAPTNSPSGTPKWVELYYPVTANVITVRPAGMSLKGGASPCPPGYSLVGTRCYSNCPAGYIDNGTMCSAVGTVAGAQVAVNTFKIPDQTCASGFTIAPTGTFSCISQIDGSTGAITNGQCANNYYQLPNNVCVSSCPSGHTTNVTDCIPPISPKASTPVVTNNYSCPTGTLTNNKCLSCATGYTFDASTQTCKFDASKVAAYTAKTMSIASVAGKSYANMLTNNTDDQTITLSGNGGSFRYIRIRPPETGGDGIINFSQIMILDTNGNNVAKGKMVTGSSTGSGFPSASVVVDGSTTLRAGFKRPTLNPTSWDKVGENLNYPTANNIGAAVAVTGLDDAKAKCLATPGCTGFSITSGSSPMYQPMKITASTQYTPGNSINSYANATLAPIEWKEIVKNSYFDGGSYVGSEVTVKDEKEIKEKALNTSGCNGYTMTSTEPYIAYMVNLTSTTSYINNDWEQWNGGYFMCCDIETFVGTLEAAKEKCLSMPLCGGFAYGYGEAYLKTKVTKGTRAWDTWTSDSRYNTYIFTKNITSAFLDTNWVETPQAHHGSSDYTIAEAPSLTLQQAKAQCKAMLGCTEFSFWRGANQEYGAVGFKNVPQNVPMTGYRWAPLSTYSLGTNILNQGVKVSGNTVYVINEAANWVVTPNSQHYGQGDIGSFVGSVSEAKAKCLSTPGCTEFVYAGDTAYLKNMLGITGVWDSSYVYSNGVTTYALTDSAKQSIISNGVWSSAKSNRTTEFIEVDLGSNTAISKVRLIGRSDYNVSTNNVDRMTGVRIELYTGSETFVVPAPSAGSVSQTVQVKSTDGLARYVRIRPASMTGVKGPGYDGYLTISEVMIPNATEKPVFVTSTHQYGAPGSSITSGWKGVGNFFSLFPTSDAWSSATTETEKEFAEIDLGKENGKTYDTITIAGQAGITQDRITGIRVEIISEALSNKGCPTGYTRVDTGTTASCVENCLENYFYFEGQCKPNFPKDSSPIQTAASYIPSCPSGATESGGLCYSPCPAGSTDIGSNRCQPPNIRRAQGAAPTFTPFRLCTPPLVFVASINACSPVCPAGSETVYTGGQTKCLNGSVTRSSVDSVASYMCNSNEILRNGNCMSKCPDGTAPDGELCMPEMKVVELKPDSTIKCTSSPYKDSKKWMCESSDDLTSLLTNPTDTTTYVSPTDQVCVSESESTKMYFCITGAEAKNGLDPLTTLEQDFANTCQSITKSYTDLSNNLTNLIKIQSGMQGGSSKLGTARDNLNSIYSQMSCTSASGKKLDLCNQIRDAASTVGTNSSDVLTTLNRVIPSLVSALDTRDTLLGYKTKFLCPK